MISSPISSWQIDGEIVGTVTDFIFLASKIMSDGDCGHEIQTLVPWKKNYDTSRQHIKSRDIILPTKVHLVKAIIFPVVMCQCESWVLMTAECQKIDAFKLCWRRCLESPLVSKEIKLVNPKGNQS